MDAVQAVSAYAQAEKIKSGIERILQCTEYTLPLDEPEKRGAESLIRFLLEATAQDTLIAGRIAPDDLWQTAVQHIDLAIVMAKSGVIHEVGHHLVRALTQVTTIAQRSAEVLQSQGLFGGGETKT